ncbi:hypothetical protein FJ365_03755 [Candidatus Dependentiae bacterium]|nr:hypothetical protein [Candidatus Dependentiae bacterium]
MAILLSIKEQLLAAKWPLISMWAVGLLLRLIFFNCFTMHGDHAWLSYDSQQYHDRAQHLVMHGTLVDETSTQKAYRLPGYPLFLACWYALAENGLMLGLYIQILLASLIPLLVFLLAHILFPLMPCIAYTAGWVTTFHLGFVLFAGMVATETVAVILLLLVLLILLQEQGLAAAGFLLGFLSLIRPVGHYLVILIACWLLWQRYSYKKVGLFLGSWFLVVLPWLLRNFLLVGGICFHTLPGIHFLQYSAAAVVMQRDHVSYLDARRQLLALWDSKVQAQKLSISEYQRCITGEKLATNIMRRHPVYVCKHALTELFKTLCALHATQMIIADVGGWPVYTAETTWWEKIGYNLAPPIKTTWLQPIIYWDVLSTIFILFFSLIGLLLLLLQRRLTAAIALCVLVAGLLWGVTFAYGCARLRLPFEPIMIIFGGYGVYTSWCWFTGKKMG